MLCTVYSESSSSGHFYSVEPEVIIVLLQVWRLYINGFYIMIHISWIKA